MDEAHKTVGDSEKLFSHLLHDRNLKIRRRLFMTATERRYKGSSETVLSMEDPATYGETFHLLSFKQAVQFVRDFELVFELVFELAGDNRGVRRTRQPPASARYRCGVAYSGTSAWSANSVAAPSTALLFAKIVVPLNGHLNKLGAALEKRVLGQAALPNWYYGCICRNFLNLRADLFGFLLIDQWN